MKGVALVTGAARNIGRAIAGRLARDGFDVACVGRTPESLAEVVRDVEGTGGYGRWGKGSLFRLQRLVCRLGG